MWVVSANTQFVTVIEKTISGVHVSQVVQRYYLGQVGSRFDGNNSPKNYQNRVICVKIIVSNMTNISVVF